MYMIAWTPRRQSARLLNGVNEKTEKLTTYDPAENGKKPG